jgi:hypothetical protein
VLPADFINAVLEIIGTGCQPVLAGLGKQQPISPNSRVEFVAAPNTSAGFNTAAVPAAAAPARKLRRGRPFDASIRFIRNHRL